MTKITFRLKGGTGSGNFGHAGRPGKIGGSSGGGALLKFPIGSQVKLLRSVGNAQDGYGHYKKGMRAVVVGAASTDNDFIANNYVNVQLTNVNYSGRLETMPINVLQLVDG